MSLEVLQKKRQKLENNTDITIRNMEKLANESERTAQVAGSLQQVVVDLENEFEKITELNKSDVAFLLFATVLQLSRIAIINEVTKIQKAGTDNETEEKLHGAQEKILDKFSDEKDNKSSHYYASIQQIVSTPGVPYDAVKYVNDKNVKKILQKNSNWRYNLEKLIPKSYKSIFKGANHRFATLGHDPILGLIFGTANILTNTITSVEKVAGTVPVISSNHVLYSESYSEPLINQQAQTRKVLSNMMWRARKHTKDFVAALIKQIIHIGTDMFTPCGIQLPGANLVLSNENVEKLTRYISTGDIVKIGTSAVLAETINMIIALLHRLTYKKDKDGSEELFAVRTRKILTYSNIIASASNVLWVAGKATIGDAISLRQLDIGGFMVTAAHIFTDEDYVDRIKEDFINRGLKNMIIGEEFQLEEVVWDVYEIE